MKKQLKTSTTNSKWTHKFPKEPGTYWFIGERWKRSKFEKQKKEKMKIELAICTVFNVSNGTLTVCDGNFMYQNELGDEWYFTKASLPPIPKFKNDHELSGFILEYSK